MASYKWRDPDGQWWDSEYEYRVYDAFRVLGFDVRRCSAKEGDTFNYHSTVTKGRCLECEGTKVVQERSYTPDLLVRDLPWGPTGSPSRVYIEAKGKWPASKRRLLRSAYARGEAFNLLLVFGSKAWLHGTQQMRPHEYVEKYLPGAGTVYYSWSRAIKTDKTRSEKLRELKAQLLPH